MSEWRYHHLDERGSTIAWSDASGALASISKYDEYGIPTSTNPGRFGYTGQLWLPEIGTYHYKARAYAPQLGRFLQMDPIWPLSGMNGYAYVGNDPVNRIDPMGLADCGLESNWRSGNCAKDELKNALGAMFTGLTTADINFAAAQYFSFFSGEASFGQLVVSFAQWDAAHDRANNWEDALRSTLANFVQSSAVVALEHACRCDVNDSIIGKIDWNAAEVLRPSSLPNIFDASKSLHGDAKSAALSGTDYVLKVYFNDPAYGGRDTIAITTPNSSLSHYINIPFWLMGDPVNALNARRYCSQSGRC